MQGSAEILQEYLVKLGYQVDTSSFLKFNENLNSTQKRLLGVGSAVAAAIAATAVATTKFAYATRRSFFNAELAGTSTAGLTALGKAAEQIGVSADSAESSLKNFGIILNSTAANKGFFEQITGQQASIDNAENYLALIKSLKDQYGDSGAGKELASQFAEHFGISKEEYLLMSTRIDELTSKYHKNTEEQNNLFSESEKEKLKNYANAMDDLGNSLEFAGQKLMILSSTPLNNIADFIRMLFKGGPSSDPRWEAVRNLSDEDRTKYWKMSPNEREKFIDTKIGGGVFSEVEKKYNLPSGLLDSMWLQESNRGKNMVSPAGATGHFQFMPDTAKQFGMSTEDTYDLKKSSESVGKYMGQLIKKYGSLDTALQAYNWGPGNVDKYLSGQKSTLPSETSNYSSMISGRLGATGSAGSSNSTTMNNTFNITGGDPNAAASAVEMRLNRMQGDVIRNTAGL
jgi:hypothetical protein